SCNEREALPHLAVDLRGPTGQSTAVGFSGLRCEYSKTVYVRDSRDGQVPSYGAAHVGTVHVRPPLAQIPVHEMVYGGNPRPLDMTSAALARQESGLIGQQVGADAAACRRT